MRLMLPPNFLIRHVKNSEVSQMYHLRESLETVIRQLRQLSCILDSCTIAASYQVVKRKKHCYSCRVQLGLQAHHPVNSTHRYHCQQMMNITPLTIKTSSKNTSAVEARERHTSHKNLQALMYSPLFMMIGKHD